MGFDGFDERYAQTDPTAPASGSDRVFHGGSWLYGAVHCRMSNRNYNTPTGSSGDIGLRLAL